MVVSDIYWPFSYWLSGNNYALQNEFLQLLHGCSWLADNSSSATIKIYLHTHSDNIDLNNLPEPLPALLVDWRELKIFQHQDSTFFTYQSWSAKLQLTDRQLEVWGPAPPDNEALLFREFFLRAILLFFLRRQQFFELHAAAALPPHQQIDQAGYLFLGPSGSGKTSTLLALIRSGWYYLADDALLLQPQQEQINVYPLRRTFSLTLDSLAYYPKLKDQIIEAVPFTNKKRLDPQAIWPQQYINSFTPKFIIVCRIVDKEFSSLRAISRTHLLTQLIEATPWIVLDRATSLAQLTTFRQLTTSCQCFELQSGRDLLENSDRLSALLDSARLKEVWQAFEQVRG